jgi:hypothetical protein
MGQFGSKGGLQRLVPLKNKGKEKDADKKVVEKKS